MSSYRERVSAQLLACTNERAAFAALTTFANSLGFEYCCYLLRMPVPAHRPAVEILDSCPPGWIPHYLAANFIKLDPTVVHGSRSSRPIVWSQELFAAAPSVWRDANRFGLRAGIAQSCWMAGGAFGLLTLARSSGAVERAEARALAEALAALSALGHERMVEFVAPRLVPECAVSLTAREREVLRWTSDGKTSAEISHLLSIAERTVNFHINNVLHKFNAPNRMHATVRAIALGLL